MGEKPRTAITFKTNLICGERCFEHTDDNTSIMEIDRQYDVINRTMNINVVEFLDYNQTSVVIRYFYQEEGPIVYSCRNTSYVHVTQDRNLTLCGKLIPNLILDLCWHNNYWVCKSIFSLVKSNYPIIIIICC